MDFEKRIDAYLAEKAEDPEIQHEISSLSRNTGFPTGILRTAFMTGYYVAMEDALSANAVEEWKKL